jgi:hypothetical protein
MGKRGENSRFYAIILSKELLQIEKIPDGGMGSISENKMIYVHICN